MTQALRSHLQKDLEMTNSTIDEAPYIIFFRQQFDGLYGTHVDEMLKAVNPKYADNAKKIESSFQRKPLEYDNVFFTGSGNDWDVGKFDIYEEL